MVTERSHSHYKGRRQLIAWSILFAVIACISVVADNYHGIKSIKLVALCSILSIITLFVGLRVGVGTNYESYRLAFNVFEATGYDRNWEAGYTFLMWFASSFNLGFHGLMLLAAGITFGFAGAAMYRDGGALFLGFVALLGMGFLFFATNGVRQAIAVSIILFGYRFIWSKRPLLFLCAIGAAALFHHTAAIAILAYFLRIRYIPLTVWWGVSGAAALLFVFPEMRVILQYPFEVGGSVLGYERYLQMIFQDSPRIDSGLGVVMSLVIAVGLIVFGKYYLNARDDKTRVLARLYLLGLLGSVALSTFWAVTRLPVYFEIAGVLFLPLLINRFRREQRVLVGSLATLYFSTLYFWTVLIQPGDLVPYASVLFSS